MLPQTDLDSKNTNHTHCTWNTYACITYTQYHVGFVLSYMYVFIVSYFWMNATTCLRRGVFPGTDETPVGLLNDWKHSTAECGPVGELSRHCCCCCPQITLSYCFPSSLYAACLFPKRDTQGGVWEVPSGHRDESKVNTLRGGCKKTRSWKLRSQSESTCSRRCSINRCRSSLVPKISHVKVIKGALNFFKPNFFLLKRLTACVTFEIREYKKGNDSKLMTLFFHLK